MHKCLKQQQAPPLDKVRWQPATERELHEQACRTCEQTGEKRWFGGSPKIRPGHSVPSLDQAAIGATKSVIANEYPRATPLGP